MRRVFVTLLILSLGLAIAPTLNAAELAPALAKLRAVGLKGEGNKAASEAWPQRQSPN
jgi:hypothetical protein